MIPITDYRIYRINSAGKIAGPPLIVQQESDDAVLQTVREEMIGQAVEVWDGNRRVATISVDCKE